jgi:hypothetical protein
MKKFKSDNEFYCCVLEEYSGSSYDYVKWDNENLKTLIKHKFKQRKNYNNIDYKRTWYEKYGWLEKLL